MKFHFRDNWWRKKYDAVSDFLSPNIRILTHMYICEFPMWKLFCWRYSFIVLQSIYSLSPSAIKQLLKCILNKKGEVLYWDFTPRFLSNFSTVNIFVLDGSWNAWSIFCFPLVHIRFENAPMLVLDVDVRTYPFNIMLRSYQTPQ